MYGWIQDCIEELVIRNFGKAAWRKIKVQAGVTEQDGTFRRHAYYDEAMTYSLVGAACEVLGLSASDVLKTFGGFFVQFVAEAGYDGLMKVQGNTLKEFLQNMNCMHYHLQGTLPQLVPPDFRVEEVEGNPCSLILHYWSMRQGLAPIVEGTVLEAAKRYFGQEVAFDGYESEAVEVDGTPKNYTRFVIRSVEPLTKTSAPPTKGVAAKSAFGVESDTFSQGSQERAPVSVEILTLELAAPPPPPLSLDELTEHLPFHIVLSKGGDVSDISEPMRILSLGRFWVDRLREEGKEERVPCLGGLATNHFSILSPPGVHFRAESFSRACHSFFRLRCKAKQEITVIGGMVSVDAGFMFLGSLDVSSMQSLQKMGCSLSSLPVHDATRKVVLMGEEIAAEKSSASHMEEINIKLSKSKRSTVTNHMDAAMRNFIIKDMAIQLAKVLLAAYDYSTDVGAFMEVSAAAEHDDVMQAMLIPFAVLLGVSGLQLLVSLAFRARGTITSVHQLAKGQVEVIGSEFDEGSLEESTLNRMLLKVRAWNREHVMACVKLFLIDLPMMVMQVYIISQATHIATASQLLKSVFLTMFLLGVQSGGAITIPRNSAASSEISGALEAISIQSTARMQKYGNRSVNRMSQSQCPVVLGQP